MDSIREVLMHYKKQGSRVALSAPGNTTVTGTIERIGTDIVVLRKVSDKQFAYMDIHSLVLIEEDAP
ncbi:MAG: hypothetical protein A3H57_00280 [Candidatus Taylorbacteria bacterium RIFCSPLOWO2_02_FULL_43_11]|uniref:DUF2642 domain-containing protein n=1 Tax=Candidatus Taylorbacteria bacterium RIFCSPHIGHO2_02_FULL_43_32b TaxID=1802306 RepID=A0A1G2MHI9_9BACT|nr:MAG: hypothetical protein A2743_00715 [Candidatus Taylorbacteria bacterium RIFCSPHIGHO2_01_FULL_43_47]OHA22501.1 MAG: hypothetical protein A3C72_00190 [Candidatus Taylorbacteria bacterium RIFCSPHIGHO2_02_FULL_43_32b]OHA29408.1 MAG: hypothetical protein A3B08_03840 [Candidatus Taylorbacteria bacterium RIFCSPLOWO2_01_FULL_43_44]OHA35910.1 MAG: hypothetical protein A3H57_00280 [Candidatus Taylorbacteria bacterium RIFCSPLOWO2_02_FULL_43_11]